MVMVVMATARSKKAAPISPISPISPIRCGRRRCIKPCEVLPLQTISKFRGAGLKHIATASRRVRAAEFLRRHTRPCKSEHTARQCQRYVAPHHVRASVDTPATSGSAAPLRWLAHGENLAPYEAGQTLPDPNFAAPACQHVALLTPEALPRVGLSPGAKVLGPQQRVRRRGCGIKRRAV